MGGVDKGLVPLRGKPLVAHVLQRLKPQVDEVLIGANRNLAAYEAFGFPVVRDAAGGFAGPLAGLEQGLATAQHPLVVTVPCDSPLLPADLVARLRAPLDAGTADVAVATTAGQLHPVFCLSRRSLLPHLRAFLARGGRKMALWYSGLRVAEVPFDDEPEAFRNINTLEELARLEDSLP